MGVNTFNKLNIFSTTEEGKKLLKHFYELMLPDRDLAEDYFNGTAKTMEELDNEFEAIIYDDLEYTGTMLSFSYYTRGLCGEWLETLEEINDISIDFYFVNDEMEVEGEYLGQGQFSEKEMCNDEDDD